MKTKIPDITFIVSAYDDPTSLACVLWSLACQTHKNIDVIVTDNTTDADISRAHRKMVKQVSSELTVRYEQTARKIRSRDAYHSAEWGAKRATGRFLCFPCDDCYYAPQFAQRILAQAYASCFDFVECGVIGGPDMTGVPMYLPMEWRTIKSNFIVKAELFRKIGFKGKSPISAGSAADQYFGYQVRKSGVLWGKMRDVMVVHN